MKKSKVDRLGRIVIPIQYRRALGLSCDSEINIDFYDNQVIITASQKICRLCGTDLEIEKEIPLCESCIKKVKEEMQER